MIPWTKTFTKHIHKIAVVIFCGAKCTTTKQNTTRHIESSDLSRFTCLLECYHYNDVRMSMVASQITSLTIVYSAVYSGADQRKHQSSASLAFVRGIHRWPMNYPHKGIVTPKMFPFDDVIMFLDSFLRRLLCHIMLYRTFQNFAEYLTMTLVVLFRISDICYSIMHQRTLLWRRVCFVKKSLVVKKKEFLDKPHNKCWPFFFIQ